MQTRSSASPQARARAALELRRRAESGELTDKYETFKQAYWDNPVSFARDCVDWRDGQGLAVYQEDALEHLPTHRRVSVRGPHGLGKTTTAALVILWFALTRDGKDWKLVTTASAWRQLEKYLWPEVHKWARRLRWDAIGRKALVHDQEILQLSIKLSTGEAFAVASSNAELIEGAHADHLLYVFDEAKAIPDDTWDAAEGAFSTGNCMALAISTPGEPQGRFYEIHKRAAGFSDWWVKRVTMQDAISAGRMDAAWAELRRKQWGEKSAVFQNRVAGEFAASDEDGIIALAWVEKSNERWQIRQDANDWGPLTRVGADIGRGGDPSVLARRHGDAIKGFEEINERDVMGVGAGVVDRLRELFSRDRVIAFNASEGTTKRDQSNELGFVNMRSWSWWSLREMLQNDMIDLPPHDTLTGELTAPHYRVMSGGKVQVESKDDIKKRLKRSTNYADAAIMALIDIGSEIDWAASSDLGHVEEYSNKWS
jgi:hypothetical protein